MNLTQIIHEEYQKILKEQQETKLKIRKVHGEFYCDNNNLTSLEGAPKTVGDSFSCSYNKLTSLQGSPETVGGHFNCLNNNLTSLQGAPETVGGDFSCSNNKVKFTEYDVRNVSNVKGNIKV